MHMPCMQAFLAFAVSWPKLDKVKDLLIGHCVIFVALLLLPKFYMLLELVLLNCTVCSSRSFFFRIYTWLCLCSFFVR